MNHSAETDRARFVWETRDREEAAAAERSRTSGREND